MDFLEHEVFVATLFGGSSIEAELGDLAVDGDVVQVADVHRVRGDDGDVVVVGVDHALGVRKDRGGIGGDDCFTFAHADDDRAAASGGDDFSGFQ